MRICVLAAPGVEPYVLAECKQPETAASCEWVTKEGKGHFWGTQNQVSYSNDRRSQEGEVPVGHKHCWLSSSFPLWAWILWLSMEDDNLGIQHCRHWETDDGAAAVTGQETLRPQSFFWDPDPGCQIQTQLPSMGEGVE